MKTLPLPTTDATRGPARAHRAERPLVVEVAGPASAGKSTLARTLQRLDPEILARPRLTVPQYVLSVPPLLPVLVGLHRPFRGILRKEMKRVVRLGALHRFANRITGCRTLLFDEGPVYLLARTLVYGGQKIETRGFARWWKRAIAQWAATLDVVIWLDAPDGTLSNRIVARRRWHRTQSYDDQRRIRFLQSYRAAFSRILDELTAARGPQLWTLATAGASPHHNAEQVLARLHAQKPR